MKRLGGILLAGALACGGAGDPPPPSSAFCDAYDEHLDVTTAMEEANDAQALRTAADDQRAAVDALHAAAPDELLDDVDRVIDLWDRVLKVLHTYDHDAVRLVNEASREERGVFLDLNAAGGPTDDPTRIVQDWVRSNCPGVSVPPPPSFSPTGQSIDD